MRPELLYSFFYLGKTFLFFFVIFSFYLVTFNLQTEWLSSINVIYSFVTGNFH